MALYTEKELALATGLSLSELRRYLRLYGSFIPTTGTGPKRFSALSVERVNNLNRIRALREKPRKQLIYTERLDVTMDEMLGLTESVHQLLDSVEVALQAPPVVRRKQHATDGDSLPLYLQAVRPPKLASVKL